MLSQSKENVPPATIATDDYDDPDADVRAITTNGLHRNIKTVVTLQASSSAPKHNGYDFFTPRSSCSSMG